MAIFYFEPENKALNHFQRFSVFEYCERYQKALAKVDIFLRLIISIILPVLALNTLTNSLFPSILKNQILSGTGNNVGKKGDDVSSAPSSEWLLAAYGGAPYTYPSDVRVSKSGDKDFTVKNVEWRGLPFINPIYYGARIVRWFSNARTGAMLDFTHSKAISVKDQKVVIQDNLQSGSPNKEVLIKEIFNRLEASHGHNMLTLNAMFRLPSLSYLISPYVGLGAGVSLPHAEVHLTGDPTRTYEYQMAGPVGQALIGLEIRLPRMSYFVEYKFTFADYRMPLSGQDGYILFTDLWRQFRRWFEKDEPSNGWADTKFSSHQIIGGLGVRLQPVYAP